MARQGWNWILGIRVSNWNRAEDLEWGPRSKVELARIGCFGVLGLMEGWEWDSGGCICDGIWD